MLGMLYLLIVCRDCLNAEYLKFVGGFTIGTVVLDLVWISIYKVINISIFLELVEWN